MFRLIIIVAVVAAALLRGGSLRNFADVRLRALPLVFASFGLQLLIFTPFMEQPLIPMATSLLYVLSMALLVYWAFVNRGVPGMALVIAGVVMNTAAIALNGGYMPVDPLAAEYAGRSARYATEGLPVANNSLATSEGVQLWLLTDIFPVPAGIPLANVYSLGDILLTTGIGIFCYRVIRGTQDGGKARAVPAPPARPATGEPLKPTA